MVKNNGITLLNTESHIESKNTIELSGNKIAEECGSILCLNMVMLGALIKATDILKFHIDNKRCMV